METDLILIIIGCIIGFCIRPHLSLSDKPSPSAPDPAVKILKEQVAALQENIAERDRRAERNRQYRSENDLSDPSNQLRFIRQCRLHVRNPVNKEASRVLYAIDNWIRNNQPKWRFSFEVAMGSFIKTDNNISEQLRKNAFSSYNSKRVDFLLIDRFGTPRLVIEYNGSGHDLSGDAKARMAVKNLTLQRVGIPLLEIPENMPSDKIEQAISAAL